MEITVKPQFDPNSRYAGESDSTDIALATNEKDVELHAKLMIWWREEKQIQSANRYQQAIDEDFYDGLQWAEEDVQALSARGQAALVYNLIKQSVDWLLGTEKRNRIDFNVYPRSKDNSKTAEVKKQLLKFVNDQNKTTFARSRAFADSIKAGVGWLEDSIIGDDTKEPISSGYASWRHIWYDSQSVKPDMSDGRRMFRSMFVDLDVAVAMFPEHKLKLEQCVTGLNVDGSEQQDTDDLLYSNRGDEMGVVLGRRTYSNSMSLNSTRQRVRLIECWYREPVTVKRIRGGQFSGQEFDSNNPDHTAQLNEQYATLTDALVMKMNCALMCETHILQAMPSPYKHNDFPFTPIWAYRRARDNAPYGVIRELRDPQESMNKRHSKAIHILSTNQIIADEDATSDWDDIKNQAARPDGILLLDGRSGARFEINNDKQLAQQHINLMELDAKMIRDVSGITDANMGQDSRAISGVAMDSQEEQGSIATTELFDNFRHAFQIQGEKQLSLIEQFYDEEKIIRVTGKKGAADYVPINEQRYDEQSGTWVTINPMTATRDDFVVDEQNYQANLRTAMFKTMTEMLRTLPPDISLQLLDLVYDNSEFPAREEFVARIRKINGQADPNAEETPETQQAEAAQQQKAQAEQEHMQVLQQLEIEKLKAEIDKIKSATFKDQADVTVKNVEGIFSAIQANKEFAGLTPAQVMALAQMTDELYKSAGGKDFNAYPIINNPQAIAGMPVEAQQQNTHPQFPANPDVGMRTGMDT